MIWIAWAATPILTLVLAVAIGWGAFRWAARRFESSLGQPLRHTFWEMLFTLRAHSLPSLLLTLQRSQNAKPAEHPMGSAPAVDWMNLIGFDPATFALPPAGNEPAIDLSVSIGARAQHPLTISMPVLIAPMGYGVGLAAETKVALAQAASLAGIAVVSGEGAYIPEERAYAARWVLQESRGSWAHQPGVRGLADMIEIQWGQASEGGGTVTKPLWEVPKRMAAAADGNVVIAAAPGPIDEWVDEVRQTRPDCPLGVKIPASQHLEEDLAFLTSLSIDAVTLDGSGAGSAGSPAVVSDHFGITAVLACRRAHEWLTRAGLRSSLTLMVSGGIRDAADIVRLLALGADAVMVGTEPLMAALHGQVSRRGVPVSPTDLAFARSEVNQSPKLDVGDAAEHVFNWLESTRQEIQVILRTAGLTSLEMLRTKSPLLARSDAAAQLFALPFDARPGLSSLAQRLWDLDSAYQDANLVLERLHRILAGTVDPA